MHSCPTSTKFKKAYSFGMLYGKKAATDKDVIESFGNPNLHNDILLSDEEIYLYLDDDIAVTKDFAQDKPFHILIWFNICNVRNPSEIRDKYPDKFDKVMNAISRLGPYLKLEEMKVWFTERSSGKYHAHIQITNGDVDVVSPQNIYRQTRLFFKIHY